MTNLRAGAPWAQFSTSGGAFRSDNDGIVRDVQEGSTIYFELIRAGCTPIEASSKTDLSATISAPALEVATTVSTERASNSGNKAPRKRRHPCCEARTRSGALCRAPGIGRGGRCKLHGGKSSGPKTPEGKERSLAAMQAGFEKYIEKYRAQEG